MSGRLRRVLARLTPEGNVADRAVVSGVWVTALNVGDRLLQLAMTLVVARLVGPNAFGLLGVALLALSTVTRFSQLGLNEALVHDADENVDRYLDTTLALQAGRGVLLAGVLYVAAPTVTGVLGEPRATDVVRAIGVVPLLAGLRNPGIVYFRKRLEFHRQFAYRISGSVAQFVVGVGYALVSPTVWALVAAVVAARATELVASYLAHGYRPRPGFDLEAARTLLGYGKWITGGAVVYFLYSEGDDAVVAWLLGATSLGFYRMAYRLANAPATELSEVIRKVTFPAYAQLQDDVDALRDGFVRTLQVTALVSVPAAVGLAVVTPTLVRVALGPDWTTMITTMQLLCAYGLLLSITATFSPVWKAVGRPDISTKLGALRVVLLAALIVPATNAYGIEGTAALVVGIYVFPMVPLDTYFLVRSIDASYRRLVTAVAAPAVASALMGGVVLVVRRELDLAVPAALAVELVALIALGAVVYAVAMLAIEYRYDWGLQRNLRTVVDAVRE